MEEKHLYDLDYRGLTREDIPALAALQVLSLTPSLTHTHTHTHTHTYTHTHTHSLHHKTQDPTHVRGLGARVGCDAREQADSTVG